MARIAVFYLAVAAVGVGLLAARGDWGGLVPVELEAWLAHGALGLGVGLAMVVASRVATSRFAWASRLADEFRALLGTFHRREALAVALLSSVTEELVFRGLLQPAVGLWLAAAVFAALHVGPTPRFLPWTAMAFVAGLALGWLFEQTGNLLAPIVAHATVNYLNLRFLAPHVDKPDVHVGPVGGPYFAGL